jgi:hypothetical protein
MQTIDKVIAEKRQEITQLQTDIDALERAQALMGGPTSVKRRGRPPGSRNKSTKKSGKKRGRPAKKAGRKAGKQEESGQ